MSIAVEAPDRMVAVGEVAEVLGVHENSVWTLVREGQLPSYKIRGCRRFFLSEVLSYVRENYRA